MGIISQTRVDVLFALLNIFELFVSLVVVLFCFVVVVVVVVVFFFFF